MEQENRLIAAKVEEIHRAYPDKGYRRIRDDMERYYGMHLNDKRVLGFVVKKTSSPPLSIVATDVPVELQLRNL